MNKSEKKFEISNLAETLFERFYEDWGDINIQVFFDYLKTKIDQSIGFDSLENKIDKKTHLKVKMGIDPTGPDVHLGHLLPILVLRQFQKAGHIIDLIIGDFTAKIGDPSGRNTERAVLSDEQIKKNMTSYKAQIAPYLNLKEAKTHFNSKWLLKINFEKILSVFQKISVSEVLQREDFRKRIESGHGLSMAELLYSYAQGEDSVALKSDVEVGGKDQLLNFAQGRTIMSIYGLDPEVALTTPVLEGIFGDGKKMSKSMGNYIAVTASDDDKFGKIMSIPDSLIMPYFEAFSDIKTSEIDELKKIISENPLEAKKQLAMFIVAIGKKNLKRGFEERESFENRFSKKEFGGDIPKLEVKNKNIFDAIFATGEFKSKGELLRLFEQKAVKIIEPNEKVLAKDDKVSSGIVKVGKIKFYRIS